jgi:NADH-ubiquinone oxidoreductase chain 1
MFFLFILGISIYSLVLAGWSRFRKFGYIGGIRASSQTVSYEVLISLLVISFCFFFFNFFFLKIKEKTIIFFLWIFFLWIFSLISETNRAPLDFSEGERELISGFNIEYGRRGFILFFLSEYSIIIFFSLIRIFFFNLNLILFFLILFFFISLRTSFPRFRYDFLLILIWFKLLPFLCRFLFLFLLF